MERLLDRGAAEIQSYLHGKRVDFRHLKIDWAGYSPFGERVLSRLRRVPWGRTASYGDLAQTAGAPGASRAVGQVLRSNRLPVVLPCHRIIRKSGALGGFSRGGLWKKRLLKLESACVDKS
ncbi:MAG: methylated-DNA--[protein]-cysteine S-methyltransferase [Candidatus Omnitrophica bacterium]|nr:methylated-DNA--[protein]-cysteine S-methyltransferase [Candidatus Omnitrophota bacterium]